jgi:uncharacterized membrane protein YcaP (DUF421 family)
MDVDWGALFVPEAPVEMVVRGTAMYWFLFLLFRSIIRRRIGAVGIADILVLVIIADAAQNAMAGTYTSVTDGFILVATLIGWTVLNDWASYRFRVLQRLLEPPPLLLVRDGRVLLRNLRAELISEAELRAKLRENGISELKEAKAVYMESDGQISVIKRQGPSAS